MCPEITISYKNILAKKYGNTRFPRQIYYELILLPNKQKAYHDDVIKWKHFPRYWFFVRGIHRSPVNSPEKASDV